MNPDIGALLAQLLGSQGSNGALDLNTLLGEQSPTPVTTLAAQNPFAGNELDNVAGNLNQDTISGGNENQMQAGAQTGAFNTIDQTGQSTAGVTSNDLASLLQSLTNTNSATSGVTSQGTSGTATSTPIDTLGMGAALQGQIPSATAATNASQGALEQIAQQGNPYQQQLTSQAVSNALSGPGMTGTGNAAQARAASNAAQQVAQNSVGNQLTAASELGGPTALTALAGAANPFVGSQQSTSGNTVGTNASNTTGSTAGTQSGTQSSIGQSLQDMTGTQSSSGTAAGSSASTAAGEVPQSSSSSGGCYVCSALASKGVLGKRSIRAAVRYKLWNRKDRLMAVGYSVYGPWLARLVLHNLSVQKLMTPVAKLVLYQELRLLGKGVRFRLDAYLLHAFFHTASSALGFVAQAAYRADTRDPKIRNLLAREGLLVETKFYE